MKDEKIESLLKWLEERRCAYSYGSYMMGNSGDFEKGAEHSFQEVIDKVNKMYDEKIAIFEELGYTYRSGDYFTITNNCKIYLRENDDGTYSWKITSENRYATFSNMQQAHDVLMDHIKKLKENNIIVRKEEIDNEKQR